VHSHKVVLANGCFDLLHWGHVQHLKAARKLGDVLIVGLTRDRSVNKGAGRPVFTEMQRAEMLEPYVDSVVLVDSSLEALQRVDPDVFVKDREYRGRILAEDLAYCEARGIEIAFTEEQKYSSTVLLDRLRQSC
jgi:rfaE bifunctional protein nucleotidyltransferase chain/domain